MATQEEIRVGSIVISTSDNLGLVLRLPSCPSKICGARWKVAVYWLTSKRKGWDYAVHLKVLVK